MPRTSRSARTPSTPARKPAAPKPHRPAAPPVVVKDSPIQGSGVFATRGIAKGERIMEYVGERISHEEADRRYDDEAMERHHTFLFTLNETTCIDGGVGGNESRFINHSCAPNAWSSADGKRIFIIAGRAIAAGDEILYDYSYTLDPGDTLEKLRETYPCRCGAPNCRGTLADMPKEKETVRKKAVARKKSPVNKSASKAKNSASKAKKRFIPAKKKVPARKKSARR